MKPPVAAVRQIFSLCVFLPTLSLPAWTLPLCAAPGDWMTEFQYNHPSSVGLAKSEQESLWAAVDTARRAIQPLTEGERDLPGNEGVRLFAFNRGQQITARFLDGKVRFDSGRGGTWAGTLQLESLETAPAVPVASGNRVEYVHAGGVLEWYENQVAGIEHGFTLERRPAQAMESGECRLDMVLSGLTASLIDGENAAAGGEVDFADPDTGAAVLRYGGLMVWDAMGRRLPARFAVEPHRVSIVIGDTNAAYPLTIDPFITSQEEKLGPEVTGDGTKDAYFGFAVALSGDTALVGTPRGPPGTRGSVYAFERSGMSWSLQSTLRTSDATAGDFGWSVALSGDTALVGAPGSGKGSAFVFVRDGATWSPQGKLIAQNGELSDAFGSSVALSGKFALVGALGHDAGGVSYSGSAYVFVRSGTVWDQEAELVASDVTFEGQFGEAVALSGDTALVGASRSSSDRDIATGAAYVFLRSGTVWIQEAKLSAPDGDTYDYFGQSVALSADTALVGAPGDSTATESDGGSAYVFVRAGGAWSLQQKLMVGGIGDDAYFGSAVALAESVALVGAPGYNVTGSAYVFLRSGGAWSQEVKLTPEDTAGANCGASVALFGNTALAGAYLGNTDAGLAAGTAYVFARGTTSWGQEQKLTAGDLSAGLQSGTAVAISGDTALVGAPYDATAAGAEAGSVYIFSRTGNVWSTEAQLKPGDPLAYYRFGHAVAISGATVMVGALNDYNRTNFVPGCAYVFVRNGSVWMQQAKLTGTDTIATDFFGSSVALSGDTAVVGAASDDTDAGMDAGSAYVFARNGTIWIQQAKLTPHDPQAYKHFGHSVAVSGDTLLTGATGNGAGSAYVFVRSGLMWTQQTKLMAGDGVPANYFGHSIALSGDTALAGAYGDDTTAGTDAGSAYVFVRSGSSWNQQAKLTAADAPNERFGWAVALEGDTVLVGTPYDTTAAGAWTGSAFVFLRDGTTWSQQAILTAGDSSTDDRFGWAVALAGNTALVGAPYDDSIHNPPGFVRSDHGSVYVFRLIPAPEISVEQPDGTILTDGSSIVAFGSVLAGGSATRTFTVENTGIAELSELGITIDGSDAGTFAVSVPAVAPVAAGGQTTFVVTFASASIGAKTAQLHLANNDADENPFDIFLGGTIASPSELFNVAMSAAGITGPNAAPDAAPYHDNVKNLLKYAFNMNIAGPDWRLLAPGTGTAGLPVITRPAGSVVRYEFLRRVGSGLIYSPMKSASLASSWLPLAATPIITPLDASWERVVYEEPFDAGSTPRLYSRVEVTLP